MISFSNESYVFNHCAPSIIVITLVLNNEDMMAYNCIYGMYYYVHKFFFLIKIYTIGSTFHFSNA